MKFINALILLLLLSGCYITTETYKLSNSFSSPEVSWINDKGDATIMGQAFLNQKGGGVVTCAGKTISLIPKTPYSSERMNKIYGSLNDGYRNYYAGDIIFEPSAPQFYYNYQRKTTCDAQGNFKFKNVLGDREYFIVTDVTWEIDYTVQGGYLMLRVKPEKKETLEVILN